MKTRIDRSSPLPFYHQLKEILLDDIRSRKLQSGDRLLSDHELCDKYEVSRTVVRQALRDLETAGVIERVKGSGTFVAHSKTSEGLVQSLTGLWEDVTARGSRLRSEVRRLEVAPADDTIAEALELATESPVIVIERRRFVDDEPWVVTTTHIPYDVAPGLLLEDLSNKSLYALLENKFGVQLKRGRRAVEAVIASRALARDLGINRGAAVLRLSSVSYGIGGKPVEEFVAYHRGDRSTFEVELKRHKTARRTR
jgi:GntR family transcriptional regulator